MPKNGLQSSSEKGLLFWVRICGTCGPKAVIRVGRLIYRAAGESAVDSRHNTVSEPSTERARAEDAEGVHIRKAGVAPDEADLLQGLIRRDRKAAEEFISRYADPVYSYLHHRLFPNTTDVEDCFQQVFLAAWQGLESYRGEQGIKAWLLGIARHKVQDVYRERLRSRQWDEHEDVLDRAAAADEVVVRGEVQGKVWEILHRLPEPYRILLIWRYWEQQSGEAMARMIGKTPKSVERSLARARECFRRYWETEVENG